MDLWMPAGVLKEKFSRAELEMLQTIYNKKPSEVLVAIRLVDRSELNRGT